MTFSMDAREIAWVLSNHVNEFYGFHKRVLRNIEETTAKKCCTSS